MTGRIIRRPVITEKSVSEAQDKNIYLFEVDPGANKHQVRAEVEATFSVKVEMVRTVTRPSKKKRFGKSRRVRLTTPKKHAFVHVQQGQKISAFDGIQNS